MRNTTKLILSRLSTPAFLATAFLATAFWAPAASADEVHLNDGKILSGQVVHKGKRVYVTDRDSKYVLKASAIKKIETKKSFMDKFDERLAALPYDDSEAIFEFGLWLEKNEWGTRALRAFERVIEIDEDHRGARRKLGYKLFEGEWVSPDQLKRKRGLVQWDVDGKWYTKHDLAELRAQVKSNEKFRQQIAKQRVVNRKVQGMLKKFATFDKKKRQKAYEDLYSYAESLNSPELRKFADDTKGYYDVYTRHLCSQIRATTEVHATMTKLKRPMQTFETTLGAAVGGIFPAQTPIRIQLPEISIASVSTTVDIPAGC